jgi:proteasome alpha subunit
MDMGMDVQNQVMGYDRAATMFSPDGHLLQVEYAEKTVRLGNASIGFTCKEGVVIIADRKARDKLSMNGSGQKIQEIDNHIMMSTAGILSDARILTEKARVIAQQHRVTYDEKIEIETVIRELANIKQAFTQYGGARPFGVSIMLAGVNKKKQRLFVSDVTGNYFSYKASAIGENDEKIRELLREEYNENFTIEDSIKTGLKIFKKILLKEFDASRFEISYIKNEEEKVKKLNEEEIKKYIK